MVRPDEKLGNRRTDLVVARKIKTARSTPSEQFAMTGSSGGRSAGLADVDLHVRAENCGNAHDFQKIADALPEDTILKSRYLVRRAADCSKGI